MTLTYTNNKKGAKTMDKDNNKLFDEADWVIIKGLIIGVIAIVLLGIFLWFFIGATCDKGSSGKCCSPSNPCMQQQR
jgi:hypothetical protein